jgi:proteic killer suppression protein
MINTVIISNRAKNDLKKVPPYIAVKLQAWINNTEIQGLESVRKVPGWHDEPLHGKRKGQRSIRLSKSYRAIYAIKKANIEFVSIEEVHKHGY